MEPIGAFLDEEWESLSRMFFSEDSDFLQHFHGQELFSIHAQNCMGIEIPSKCFPTDENMAVVDESLLSLSSDTLNPNFYYFSQECSASESNLLPPQGNRDYQANDMNFPDVTNNIDASMDFCLMNCNNDTIPAVFSDDMMKEILCMKEEMGSGQKGNQESQLVEAGDSCKEMQVKRKLNSPEIPIGPEEKIEENACPTPKKKSRVSKDASRKKNVQSKKKKNVTQIRDDEEEDNGGANGQISSSCSSEDDSNASQDLNRESTSDSKGKARASRGSATDPQSLYARKRRERINERLRILQNLVPNGTKVDISTMLEEAVQYVKFLQLQIKLLSSDDLWMYAPIAYNGMDIGLYQKIVPTLLPQN